MAGGLTVGLDHLSFEDAIRDADVSRTAAYRCWPHKDAFLADLAVALAEQAIPATPTRAAHGTAMIRAIVTEHADELATPEGRAAVLDRVVRQTAADDFDLDRAEVTRWQTYLAVVMSLQTMPAGPLRDRVAEAVSNADDRLLARLERSYQRIAEFFGFRAVTDYGTLAGIGVAVMRGLVIGDLARPATPGQDLSATAFAALIGANIEPSDTAHWDQETIDAKLAELAVDNIFIDTDAPS
ncbi:hypothetical protein SAMN04489812_1229 [Microlunatus soli]|uniref:HTH tetR-type domain-containing protein n=2 Tax=Microlunatus soli TaxID=630515 RepID=A0A1H1QDQ2_9ACTN|nr:hypothetical protein SAMN04489812_1229 [Microlunatus soli]